MATKKNRCWPGYEPVKGKKPHSEGSCRPEAESKLTPKEKQFRKKRRRQLERWQAEHPRTRRSAAQHLGRPGSRPKKAKAANKNDSRKTAKSK
jgi:DNA-binding protein HU-beta